jgi:cobalt/nickel transport system permease protein
VRHGFFDRYSGRDSVLHHRDPRAKVVVLALACVCMVSEPRGDLVPFWFYYPLLLALITASRIPFLFFLKRCLIAAPFILMAALLLPLSHSPARLGSDSALILPYVDDMLSILFRAFGAVLAITLLTSTERFHRLLRGLHELRMPRILGLLSALMYRYIYIIHDEWQRTNIARKSRTPGPLRLSRFSVYGRQIAMIFIRSWERAENVYLAMTSRGFDGAFPVYGPLVFRKADWLFLLVTSAAFISVRIWI